MVTESIINAVTHLATTDFSRENPEDIKAAAEVVADVDGAVEYLQRLQETSPDIAALCMDAAVKRIKSNIVSAAYHISDRLSKW